MVTTPKTIFQINKETNRFPFIVQKTWWNERHAIAVCEIQEDERGSYARGISISFSAVEMKFVYSEYLASYEMWRKYMIIPSSDKPEWESIPYELFSGIGIMAIYTKLKREAQHERNIQKKLEQR